MKTTKKFKTTNYKNEKVVTSDDYSHIVNISKRFDASDVKFIHSDREASVHAQLCTDTLNLTIWKTSNVEVRLNVLDYFKNDSGEQANKTVCKKTISEKSRQVDTDDKKFKVNSKEELVKTIKWLEGHFLQPMKDGAKHDWFRACVDYIENNC